jgi:hypothetical protein
VQPGTASSLHPCEVGGRSNAARVRRAAHDQRRWYAGPDGVTAGGKGGEIAGPGGLGRFGLARPQVRVGVFYRQPARLDSAGVCACRAIDHARAG